MSRASPGLSYKLQDKDATCGQWWNITSEEQKVYEMEVEIVMFVINGSVKLTVPTDRQE